MVVRWNLYPIAKGLEYNISFVWSWENCWENIQEINNNSEYRDGDSKVSDYIITKVELIISGPSTDNALNSSTLISAAKVLKDIEKSHDKGKNLLEEGGKVAQNNRVTKIRFLDNAYPIAVRATPAITLIPIYDANDQ